MLVIIDYGIGNLGSIANIFKKIGHPAIISSDAKIIASAEKLILPGVGAFDYGMTQLKNKGFTELLHEKVLVEKVPVLGICLGMQFLTQGSEEGNLPGFGWIDACAKKFDFGDSLQKFKVPHMGWNVILPQKSSSLFADIAEEQRFYFVHSFYVQCHQATDILATTNYGGDFTCAIERDNIFGVQFHPEKSHKFGMRFLKKFAELTC